MFYFAAESSLNQGSLPSDLKQINSLDLLQQGGQPLSANFQTSMSINSDLTQYLETAAQGNQGQGNSANIFNTALYFRYINESLMIQ